MSARHRKILFLFIYLGLTGMFLFAFHDRFWRWRDCFNELGRCYDPEQAIVYTTGGFVWGVFAAVFACLSLLSLWRMRGSPPR